MRGIINALGGFMFVAGLGGMADAVTGQGKFIVALIVFAVGFGIVLNEYINGEVRK